MQKQKVTITGSKVHDVGYRVMLVNKALSLGVNNFNTFNTYINSTQTVIALIEADEYVIEDFKDFIRSFTPKEAIVDNIDFEKYSNAIPPIERVMQAFQMEQWGKGIPILLKIADIQGKMLEKQDSMLEKQDSMLGKQDINTSILRDFKNETNTNFDDLKTIMRKHDEDASERFVSIQKEISNIKERLSNVESELSAL